MTEKFETFDDNGRPAGLVNRSEVHCRGLWHRSVNVFLFHPDGRLYLQRRAEDKDVWPGAWDLSVAEHLQPGESYVEAARRGLQEELSIHGLEPEAWGTEFRFRTVDPERGVRDFEMQQCFRAVYDGTPRPDPVEVAEVRLLDMAELRARVRSEPGQFTPWLRHCLETLR